MRISTNYIYSNTRRTIQQSVTNLLKAQEVMATQRRINHLSDNPVDAGRILNVQSMIAQHDQFLRNIDTAATVSELYDGAMDSVVTLLKRAKELLLREANSATSTATTREASRVEIVSLASQLVATANLQYADRFLFAGYADDVAPFEDLTAGVAPAPPVIPPPPPAGPYVSQTGPTIIDPSLVTGDAYTITFTGPATYDILNTTTGVPVSVGNVYTPGANIDFDGIRIVLTDSTGPPVGGEVFTVTSTPAGNYVGDSGVIEFEVEQDVWRQTNFTGDRVFLGAGLAAGVDLFAIFERANVALRNNDQVDINNLLQEFDDGLAQTTAVQSLAGSRENLFEKTSDRLRDVKLNMQVLLSELRDADVTEAITELNRRENAYQAVLAATASVLQPNLLDFLR